MSHGSVFVGVLLFDLSLPGARSLKDRRQVVRSILDRLRHRFDVSAHELPPGPRRDRARIVVTTASEDGGVIRRILDRVRAEVSSRPTVIVGRVDVEIFPWHPSEEAWAERLLDELAQEEEDG